MKVKVISLPYIFLVLYVFVLCTRPRYQVSVYRTIGPLVLVISHFGFESGTLVLVASVELVPGHCLSFTFLKYD